MNTLDEFEYLAYGTLETLTEHIASKKTASFSNMPPLVFFYTFQEDEIHISHQPKLSVEIRKEDVSACHAIVRSALSKTKFEGLIVSCKASKAQYAGVSQGSSSPSEAPDAVVLFIFSSRLNEGVCFAFDLHNLDARPMLVDASAFGNNLDLLISPQH